MHILAIETTDLSGSAALLDGDRVLHSCQLPSQPRSAATLAGAIQDLLTAARWKPRDIKLIAVATGPGSFTGLRVGVTTAKMLAYAVGAEVIGVNTLEVIAWQAPPDVNTLWTVIDAQRQQLFAGKFERNSAGQWQATVATHICDESRWLAELTPGDHLSGPVLFKLKSKLPAEVFVVAESLWHPRAVAVGALAWQRYQSGHRDNLWSLAPQYFRLSAAEEKAQRAL